MKNTSNDHIEDRLPNTINDLQKQIKDMRATGSVGANAVAVYKTAAQNISSATFTTINFDTETFDGNNLHSNATNNSRFLVGDIGFYWVTGLISVSAGSWNRLVLTILKNGVTTLAESDVTPGNSIRNDVFIATTVQLNAGDYVELQVYQDRGIAVACNTGQTGCIFSMGKVG